MSGLDALLTSPSTPCGTWLAGHMYSLTLDESLTQTYNYLPAHQSIPAAGATTTLPLHWSGCGIVVPTITGANATLQLPTVSGNDGWNAEFRLSGALSTYTVTVKSYTANVYGVVTLGPSSMTSAQANGSTNIIFSGTAVAGDWIRVWTDGTHWFVSGQSYAAAGLSFS
jgi:hypothetical protein